jgi:beta-mannosidase
MKALRAGPLWVLLLWMLAASTVAAPPSSRTLHHGWQFRLAPDDSLASAHANATQWHQATVPGSVHTDLLANGLIPDPYVGAPEAGLQWIGLAQWEYRTTFDVDRSTRKRGHNELVFEGLDTFADIYLNGEKLFAAENAFRTWRVPVTGKLRARNELRLVFHSPIRRLLPQVQAMPHKIAGNYPSPYGDEPKDALTANFVRKPGYHYGWDWGPRYVMAGIWRAVRIESWDALRILDLHVQQQRVDAAVADLAVELEIESSHSGKATLEVAYADPAGNSSPFLKQEANLVAGPNKIIVPLRIDHPRRWYPNDYGEQALYAFTANIVDADGNRTEVHRRTGLRSVELRRDRDETGQGFTFVINGIPIFAKGANVIPFDAFPARVTRDRLRRVLESARDSHMNMVRNWGGGYYESDEFFELTDELGLLVWQDFMFGGGMQPGYDSDFRGNVIAEARDNVLRLRDHPSIVLWCGNNEEETAWKDWGHRRSLTSEDPAFAEQVWKGYVQLFDHDLRKVVAEEGGGVPYWSSSPSNDLAEKANDSNNGDKHYWDVWAGSKPIEDYLDETPRFMSEFGLQGWPSLRTIDSFASADEQKIDGPVIRAHQKFLAGEGNQRLLHYIREDYGEPKDFADFVYLSQVMQAEGIELAALHHRASRPRTMGSLYWQLNDVWPGASWSSIDYYGRWKPLHFYARRFFAPLAVAALRKDGRTTLTLVSDRTASIDAEWRLRVVGFAGKVLRDERKAVTLAPLAATNVATWADADLLAGSDPQSTAAVFELIVDGVSVSRRVVYFNAAKTLKLPVPDLSVDLVRDPDGLRLDLHSQRLARAVWIDFGELDGELSDNAITLLPGESVSLRLKSTAAIDDLRHNLHLRSLAGVVH